MEKNGLDISWLDKVTNEEVLKRVNKDRQILNSFWQRKHRWIGHVFRHDGLLHEIIEGRMKDKPTRGRRRIQMLHDLANYGGFVALKRAAEDREVRRREKGCQKPAVQQKTDDQHWSDGRTEMSVEGRQIVHCRDHFRKNA